jgi:soluble lytic murein transglycosylase-like protein
LILIPQKLGCVLLALFSSSSFAFDDRLVSSDKWVKKYDSQFRKYAKHYFGAFIDWRWFKAQGIAESDLRPDVTSAKNAYGIMQITPRTFNEIRKKGPGFSEAQIKDYRWNIAAGIYYDRYLFDKFDHIKNPVERLNYTFGSYNAGYSRINKSINREKGSWPKWSETQGLVPNETFHYVKRIHKVVTSPTTNLTPPPSNPWLYR